MYESPFCFQSELPLFSMLRNAQASCLSMESEGEGEGRRRQGNLKHGPEGTLGSFFVRLLNI